MRRAETQTQVQAEPCKVAGWVDAAARKSRYRNPRDSAHPPVAAAVAVTNSSTVTVIAEVHRNLTWSDGIVDETLRRVFVHIEKYRSITEAEVTAMLGSPRAARKFALTFESHARALPFRIGIDTVDGGKRYIRQEDV